MRIKEVTKCRVCGNSDLAPVLDLGKQALSGRFPAETEPDPPKAPLEILKCNNAANAKCCGLVQLRHSVDPGEMYLHEYGYRSGINRTMRRHLRGIVQRATEMVNLEPGDIVLDIGSNDATLLKSYEVKALQRIGIDPTGEQFRQYYDADTMLVADFFDATKFRNACPSGWAKVVTSIAMFYDLETPMTFVQDVKSILHPNGIWILEQSYLPTMLDMNSFDTICHEHLEYYGLRQILWMLERNDMRILDVELNDINGGSFRVHVCHNDAPLESNQTRIDSVLTNEDRLGIDSEKPYRDFKNRVHAIRRQLRDFLRNEKADNKSIFLYGASTKGNVLLQFCGIDRTLVTAAADRNPRKWGCRTPSTGIPIISEEDARQAQPDYFLVLPWHFRQEFLEREAQFLSSGGKFIFPLPRMEVVGAE